MKNKTYGTIRWIDDYLYAPENAEYIVRRLSNDVILEQYNYTESSITLAEFPYDAMSEYNYVDTLTQCRKIVGSNKIIWVEKPYWKHSA